MELRQQRQKKEVHLFSLFTVTCHMSGNLKFIYITIDSSYNSILHPLVLSGEQHSASIDYEDVEKKYSMKVWKFNVVGNYFT